MKLRFTKAGEKNPNVLNEQYYKSFRKKVFNPNLLNRLNKVLESVDEWLNDCNQCRSNEFLDELQLQTFKPKFLNRKSLLISKSINK